MSETRKDPAAPAPKRVKVKLTGPHTHKGEDYGKDDVIEVRDDQAQRLIEKKRAVAA